MCSEAVGTAGRGREGGGAGQRVRGLQRWQHWQESRGLWYIKRVVSPARELLVAVGGAGWQGGLCFVASCTV